MDGPENKIDILARLKEGTLERPMQLLLARGLFPVELDVLFQALVIFLSGKDDELKEKASETIKTLPLRQLSRLCASPALTGAEIDILSRVITSAPALQAILHHSSVEVGTVVEMARTVPAALQEIIITNQRLLIRHPEILDALEANPALESGIRRRIDEVRHDFFARKEEAEPQPEPEPTDTEVEEIPTSGEGLFEIPQELFAMFGMESLPDDQLFSSIPIDEEEFEDEEESTLYQKILTMNVPQKVNLALKGNKEARGILIRDANKLVKAAVVQSPKITESEIYLIAGMKDSPSEILRAISVKREWMRKYPVVHQLIFNAHTPVGVSLALLPRANDRDLKDLLNDKDVPDPLRQAAKRLRETRMKNR